MLAGGSTHYFGHDALGSVLNLTSESGQTEWTYSYDPYGNPRTTTKNDPAAPANDLRFTGEYLDPTGLYYLRARLYDPAAGRFQQRDPVPAPPTVPVSADYVYVSDQPTRYVDPSGLYQQVRGSDAQSLFDGPIFDACPTRCAVVTTVTVVGPGKLLGVLRAAGVPAKLALAATTRAGVVGDRLFARSTGLLNKNDYIRLGWGWKGTAQGGRRVFRLVIGNPRAVVRIVGREFKIHWHIP